MLATVHALVGASIATKIPDPALGASLSLLSHFIMDSIPHWDFGTNWRKRPKAITGIISIADTAVAITLPFLLFGSRVSTAYLAAVIVFSLIPDWMETPWYIFFATKDKSEPGKNAGLWEVLTYRVYRLESSFHNKAEFPLGLFTQLVTLAFFLLLLKPQ